MTIRIVKSIQNKCEASELRSFSTSIFSIFPSLVILSYFFSEDKHKLNAMMNWADKLQLLFVR